MDFQLERNIGLKKFNYTINIKGFKASSNYTYGVFPIKINMSSHYDIWELKQTSYILKLINSLPILNSETIVPFKIYVNDKYCGKSKKIFLKPVFLFNIDEDIFELRQHNNNYISLMKNDIQIALYQKNNLSVGEKNSYLIRCINNSNMLPFIILFCLFTDVVFYPNNRQLSFIKYEKSFVIKDQYKERILWRP